MKPTIPALAIIAATAGLAQGSRTIDVSGIEFFDALGAPANTVLEHFVWFGTTITHIAWDLNLTTFTPPGSQVQSWASEATITFNNGLGQLIPGFGDNFGVTNQNYNGEADLFMQLDHDGILRLEFWDSFDDAVGFADAALGSGSTITISGASECGWEGICPSPAPLSALGLTGLICTQRRRN